MKKKMSFYYIIEEIKKKKKSIPMSECGKNNFFGKDVKN